jgi:hypothetical protein
MRSSESCGNAILEKLRRSCGIAVFESDSIGGGSKSRWRVPQSSRDSAATRDQPHASEVKSCISAVFIALAIVLACADNFADPDLWMHLLLGKAILSTGHISSHEIYSYSVAGFPTRSHEWLSELVFAIAYGWCGIIGLKLIKLTCATIAMIALAAGLSRSAASPRIQRTILVLTAGALTPQMQFRPQLFTFAMLSIVMMALATEVYSGRARLWPLVLMFALWANLHGGFIIGLGALGIAAVVLAGQELLAGITPRRGLRIGCFTVLAACATLVNPIGIGIWTNVLHSVSDPLIRVIVKDWVPLTNMMRYLWQTSGMALLQVILAIGLFAAFLCSIALAPTLDDAPLTAIAIVFIGASFYMVRNLALGVIAVAIPLANHLALAVAKRARSETDSRSDDSEPRPMLIAVILVIVGFAGGVLSPRLSTWEPVPAGAVAFMKERNLRGNILNLFEWGGYVAWHLPESRIFIDTRTELVYPDALLREYAEFYYGLPGARRALDGYPTDFVLMKSATRGSRLVESDRAWKVIYQDSDATLFAPASSPIERTAEVLRPDESAGNHFP